MPALRTLHNKLKAKFAPHRGAKIAAAFKNRPMDLVISCFIYIKAQNT
jgi:hypothetical protein